MSFSLIHASDMYFVWNKIHFLNRHMQVNNAAWGNTMCEDNLLTYIWKLIFNISVSLGVEKWHYVGNKELQEFKMFLICLYHCKKYCWLKKAQKLSNSNKTYYNHLLFWNTKAIETSSKISWTASLTLRLFNIKD